MTSRKSGFAFVAAVALFAAAVPAGRAQEPGDGGNRPEPPRQAAERLLRPLDLSPEDGMAAADALVAKQDLRERLRRKAAALDVLARDPGTPNEEVARAALAYESAAEEVRKTVDEIDDRLRERVSPRGWARLLAAGEAGTGLGFPDGGSRPPGMGPGESRGPGRSGGGEGQGRRPPGNGPWNNDLVFMESPDGIRFGKPRAFVERGGVPSLVIDARGRLVAAFQWFPFDDRAAFDRVAVSTSEDGGATWSAPRPVEFPGLPEGMVRPFDPTLVLLEDGRFRMYFSARGQRDRNPFTASAISGDRFRFEAEPGVRFAVAGRPVIDCAVARLGAGWHYFAPVQDSTGKAYHAVSDDGLAFRRLDDLSLEGDRNWLGCALAVEGGLRFYGSGSGGWTAFSADGLRWVLDAGARTGGVDPGVAALGGNRFCMVSTGPRRADSGPAPFRPGGTPGEPREKKEGEKE